MNHVVGNIYSLAGSQHILAMVDAIPGNHSMITLISLDSGNRWSDPIRIDITLGSGRRADRITDEEFERLTPEVERDEIELIRAARL